MQLDDRDRKILSLLQKDSRISNADLADAVGMSASALWRKVRALEDAGVIDTYRIRVNPEALGLTFHAIVHVELTRHDRQAIEAFIQAVRSAPEVQDCYATTGRADYHLRILCADLAAYNRFMDDFLFRLPAVSSAQTNVVLKSIKADQPISV
ncbi:transcriptional regulator, AsnC family [Pseudooceanicola nitratireducens]|jgi:DNA-binding Lrp family transcriptional regulator|uniref:Transcriptional regulator, AsnC family n=2 Tax=Pseudooceanicola nitratireducens TaxID=517719 RepID=A0A1I1QQR4_9RHOB|nr:Lrp/AsnC family transcriptional regulator [Pseudooceanicola nitratireducens]SEJ76015.1 DNA-binding transcriptional regulator, Lrp family [Pseudooceanicola nitratireducens]SFD24385.1 transcriptional regulator, AsnC family [Pseudooceanicola nitratireducens]|eukprot:g20618.t1